jgi:hypothetical protein
MASYLSGILSLPVARSSVPFQSGFPVAAVQVPAIDPLA